MTQAVAVARYTVLEMSRRRLVVAVVGVGLALTVGLWIAPHVLPGNNTDTERLIVLLSGLEQVVPTAMLLCALAVGMTVINHDLDSGAVVSIFATPVSRPSYALGKLLAAVGVVLVIAAVFTVGSLVGTAFNGGGVYGVVFWTGAALAANSVLLMLLVMTLTVYLNNVIAAAIVLVFNFAASNVLILHAMVQNNVITDVIIKTLVNIAYWGVPHELTSNLERQIMQLRLGTGSLVGRGFDPMASIPGASGTVDIVFWLGYVVLICVLLFWSVRRKQV